MKKKATIVDIAVKLGITPSAVSKAFSNHPRISERTKLAVQEAGRQLDYRPNAMATGLRKGKSGLVGVLVPGIHYSFFATAIKGAEEILGQAGYSVIIAQSRDNFQFEKSQLEGLLRAQVEGIIASLSMQTCNFEVFQSIAKRVPLVLFDRTFEDNKISTVTIDDFEGAVTAVDHLIDMGYTRIAHLAGYSQILPYRRRIDGYKYALQKHGLSFNPNYLFECSPNENEGTVAMEKLFNLTDPPNAIFAASDYLALGAVKAVKERGMKIPDEVGVIGFSNEEFSSQVSPTMSTIEQFSEVLGSTAAGLLIDQIQVGEEKKFISQKKILAPKLILRESTARKTGTSSLAV